MNHSPHFQKLLRLLAPLLVAAALAPAPAHCDSASFCIFQALNGFMHMTDSGEPPPPYQKPISEPYSHLGLSLLPAVETPSPSEGVKGLRFNLLVGRHRELRGLDIGVIGNEVTGTVNALQIAGIYNWVGNPTDSGFQFKGIQVAGIMNHSAGGSDGLQFAGIMNHSAGESEGLQCAGILNIFDGESEGLQCAGILNLRAGDSKGLQCAGILNYCDGEFLGPQAAGVCNVVDGKMNAIFFQAAGILNYCADDFDGWLFPQVAGIMNYSAGDFYGWQVAGVCNVAGGTLSGFQLGLVNYTEHLKGLQIGAVNLAGTGGGVQIGLWNSAKSLEGLQIGLCNVNTDSSMPFSPIVNYSF